MAEELASPAESGLHLVHDQQRAVLAAQLLGRAPVLRRRAVHALALDRLDDERRDVVAAQLLLKRIEIAEGHRFGFRQQRAEALAELLAAVERERAGGEAVEGVLSEEDLGALSGLAGELDGRLDRLGARVAEEGTGDACVRPPDELLGQQARKQRAVHLDHVRQVEVQCLMQRGLDRRVTAAEGVHAEAGQEVEIPLAGIVVEITALGPDVVPVESDSPERPGKLRVHVALVQGEVLAGPLRERARDIEGHAAPSTEMWAGYLAVRRCFTSGSPLPHVPHLRAWTDKLPRRSSGSRLRIAGKYR